MGILSQVWWHTSFVPELRRQEKQAALCELRGQPGLHSNFGASQGYKVTLSKRIRILKMNINKNKWIWLRLSTWYTGFEGKKDQSMYFFFSAVLSIHTRLYSKNKAKLQENPESYLVGYFGNGINAAILKLFCVLQHWIYKGRHWCRWEPELSLWGKRDANKEKP